MKPQIRTQPILSNNDYELSVSTQHSNLLIRLVINISKNSQDVYQLMFNSIQDVNELAENFDGLHQFRQYIRDISHVQVNLENKNVIVFEQSKLKSKRRIQIVSIPLHFSKTIKKNLGQQLANQILARCKDKQDLPAADIKCILQGLALYLMQNLGKDKQNNQKRQQTEKRIGNIQEYFKQYRLQIQEMIKKHYSKAQLSKQQQFVKFINESIQINKQMYLNKNQQLLQQMEIIKQKLSQLTLKNNSLEAKSQIKLRQINENITGELTDISQKIKEQIRNLNNKMIFLQNINGRRVMSQLAKALKFEDQLGQLIRDFENKREHNIQLSNGITEIPQIIGQFVSLQRLEIWSPQNNKNQLSKLPDGFQKLVSLRSLKFQGCLADLPEKQIRKISHLQDLEIKTSPITKLQGIENFSYLKELFIKDTRLKQFPQIFKLPNIKIVDLSHNQISEISDQIIHMKQLQQLYIGHNPLPLSVTKQLVKNLAEAKMIKKLSLRRLKLIQLPKQLFQLRTLQYLDLSSNKFVILPSSLGQLQKLKQLQIDHCNNLTQLPSQIGLLSQLNKLGISERLVKLPAQIGNLHNLQQIFTYRSNNSLCQLPKQIGNLKNLKILNINSARLTNLPIQLWNITSLTSISLESNKIVGLPEQIGKLCNLTYFDIRRNKLTRTPISLRNLSKQTSIYLYGNPLDALTRQFLQAMKKLGFEKLTF